MNTTDLLLAATLSRRAQRQIFEPYSFEDATMLHRVERAPEAQHTMRLARVRAAWFSVRRLLAAQAAADNAARPAADQLG